MFLLNKARTTLNILTQCPNPTIENFANTLSKLNKFMVNTSHEVFAAKALVFKMQFFEDYSNVGYKFDVRAWIEPLRSLNLKISEVIDFRNEEKRRMQVEEFKITNVEAAENFEKITKEMKDTLLENARQIAEFQSIKNQLDARIEELEREGNKREELQEIVKRQNDEVVRLQEANSKKDEGIVKSMGALSNQWTSKDKREFCEFLLKTAFHVFKFIYENR